MKWLVPQNRTFDGQFKATTGGDPQILGCGEVINGIAFEWDPALTVLKVYDCDKNFIGVMAGTVINLAERVLESHSLTLDLSFSKESELADLERAIYCYGGSWIFLLSFAGVERLYLDPCGSLSVVYSRDRKAVASTTGLLLPDEEYRERFQAGLYRRLDVEAGGWIPGGLTAHCGVLRLLPNHYLDLKTWNAGRHWLPELARVDPGAAGDSMLEIVERTAASLVRSGPTVLPITGGMDSRFILAACKSFISDIELFTALLPKSQKDVFLARSLASVDQRIVHKTLPAIRSGRVERQEWLYKTSHCTGGINRLYFPSLAPVARDARYLLSGAGGEIGRAFLWGSGKAPRRITAGKLVQLFGLNGHAEVEMHIHKWLEAIDGKVSKEALLDLAYIELRLSPWAYAQSYAYLGKKSLTEISPFNNRQLISTLFSLPRDTRVSSSWICDAVCKKWPELNAVPYNRYSDYRDALEFASNLLDFNRVWVKCRKLAALPGG